MTVIRLLIAAPLVALMVGCAGMKPSQGSSADPTDPFESFNRSLYRINTAVDSATFKPVAEAYKAATPEAARQGVSNLMIHVEEPWSGVNSLAQGKVKGFFRALDRLLINTVFGFGGLADRASEWGLPAQEEDLGQTLAVWGVPEGPYLMLPFFGPSNPRDFAGMIVQFFFDPKEYAMKEANVSGLGAVELGTRVLNFRSEALSTADVLVATSTDPYAALKSAYRQQRQYDIADGKLADQPDADEMFDDQTDPPAQTGTPQTDAPETATTPQ
jgi:phospholipid-binding lipoprotein MlaA